jgi:hypothetical protein
MVDLPQREPVDNILVPSHKGFERVVVSPAKCSKQFFIGAV